MRCCLHFLLLLCGWSASDGSAAPIRQDHGAQWSVADVPIAVGGSVVEQDGADRRESVNRFDGDRVPSVSVQTTVSVRAGGRLSSEIRGIRRQHRVQHRGESEEPG